MGLAAGDAVCHAPPWKNTLFAARLTRFVVAANVREWVNAAVVMHT